MKLTKKVLSMVLCGLVVLGGSQAALVKADAQSKKDVVIVGESQYPSRWRQPVRIGMQAKGFPSIKDGWNLYLTFNGDKLTLEGPTNVGCTWTFGDTFRWGWEKKNGEYYSTVFRPGNGSAGKALDNVKKAFNNANLKAGDKIFMYGESWETSLTFPDSSLMVKGILGNDYTKGYNPRAINKNTAGFWIGNAGLTEAVINHHM